MSITSRLLAFAEEIARKAHAEQVDKCGEPT